MQWENRIHVTSHKTVTAELWIVERYLVNPPVSVICFTMSGLSVLVAQHWLSNRAAIKIGKSSVTVSPQVILPCVSFTNNSGSICSLISVQATQNWAHYKHWQSQVMERVNLPIWDDLHWHWSHLSRLDKSGPSGQPLIESGGKLSSYLDGDPAACSSQTYVQPILLLSGIKAYHSTQICCERFTWWNSILDQIGGGCSKLFWSGLRRVFLSGCLEKNLEYYSHKKEWLPLISRLLSTQQRHSPLTAILDSSDVGYFHQSARLISSGWTNQCQPAAVHLSPISDFSPLCSDSVQCVVYP